jgi:hypothetical protein
MPEKNLLTILILAVVWLLCAVAGITMIRQASIEQAKPSQSKLRQVFNELRYRLRMVVGILMLLFAGSGIFWALFIWK